MPLYRAFGLTIASDLPLTELAAGEGAADVRIDLKQGDAPEDLDALGGYAFRTPDAAFSVRGGDTIQIWPTPGVPREDISIWLLGTVMAALLHQRGMLTLHANCFEYGDGLAVAVGGESGAGKSSMAAMAADAGFPVLGDDVLALMPGSVEVRPGVLRLKLWQRDLHLVGHTSKGLERAASDLDKYHVPLPPVGTGPRKLERLYVLEDGDLGFERLRGAAAGEALVAQLYRFEVGQDVRGDKGEQFRQALMLAHQIQVWRFTRPRGDDGLAIAFEALTDHLGT
ncbi:hypothetical protein [Sphingomicrobium flavum]|uniref:hypothetical protein n=1 Tax=Sphingomicrobium flavum TaxID=1229164 RepID=UPI0021ADF103|nr:hypothetical protein [Sphingomicrobium flavum]